MCGWDYSSHAGSNLLTQRYRICSSTIRLSARESENLFRKTPVESRSSRAATRTSIFITDKDRHYCNITTIYCTDYHKQLPCNLPLSQLVLLHKYVATSHASAVVTSQAVTIPVLTIGKVGETSVPVVPVESRDASQTSQYSTGIITTSSR